MVNYWLYIAQLLLHEKCLLCRLEHSLNPQTSLCNRCTDTLPWLQNTCINCALPLPVAVKNNAVSGKYRVCGQCQKKPPPFQQCHALFHYQLPISKLISNLKFNHQLIYARVFGQLMAQQILRRYTPDQLPDMIIPVPLHTQRLRQRGFNQAQEISRICAKNLSLPLNTKQCERIKQTDSQTGLSAAERRRNIKKAFVSKHFKPNIRIALVDDVMTTGTTLNELSLCLKKAGCNEIHLWCVARAYNQ